MQGVAGDSFAQPVPGQECGPQRLATGWTPVGSCRADLIPSLKVKHPGAPDVPGLWEVGM